MRRIAALTAILIGLVVFGAPAAAAPSTYYVAPWGSDGSAGSEGSPFRTLEHSFGALRPGDTLVVADGTYRERLRNPGIVGASADSPIRVVAAPGARPVLEGIVWLKDAHHWTIDGLNVTWAAENLPSEHMVKMSGGTGWRWTGAEIWGARSFAAFLVAGAPVSWRIDHLYIHDTFATNGSNQDHLIYVNAAPGGGTIEHNVLANSPNGRGIKVGPPDPSTTPIGGVTIRNNTFFNNTGPSNIQLSYGASGNIIERNVMQRPRAGSSSISAYELNGSGNVARDNVAWESDRVLEADPGIADRGGNRLFDPRFVDPLNGDFRVTSPELAGFGAEISGAGPGRVGQEDGRHGFTADDRGYRLAATDGGIFTFGDVSFHGSTGSMRLNQPVVGMANTASGNGYWLVASDGGIFTFGDAGFHGSTGDIRLNQPIIAMAATRSGGGYWLLARDGGIFTFGDATFAGSTAGDRRTAVGMASSPSGNGYWIASADGAVTAFGDAAFHGSLAAVALRQPIVAIARTQRGDGYWLVGRDGGVFSFGGAPFYGSTGNMALNQPVVAMAATAAGYRFVAADGGIFSFGAAPFYGSTGNIRLNKPIIAFG